MPFLGESVESGLIMRWGSEVKIKIRNDIPNKIMIEIFRILAELSLLRKIKKIIFKIIKTMFRPK